MKRVYLCLLICLLLNACADTPVSPQPQGYYKVGKPYEVEGRTYYPTEVTNYAEEGMASWYGPGFYGKRTANGDIMGREDVTAAHRTLPMPSVVKVTNLDNDKSILAKVNDRGPFRKDRIIDVSMAAAKQLGFHGNGTGRVRVEFMPMESKRMAEAAKRGTNMTLADAVVGPAVQQATAPPIIIAETIIQQAAPLPAGQIDTEPLPDNSIVVTTPSMPSANIQQVNYTVPVAPTPTTTVVTTTQTTMTKGSLYVQAGAFAKQQNADAAAAKLRGLGRVEIVPLERNGATLYRVRMPATADSAPNLLDRMQQTGLVGAKIINE